MPASFTTTTSKKITYAIVHNALRPLEKLFLYTINFLKAIIIFWRLIRHPTLQGKNIFNAKRLSSHPPKKISIGWILCGDERVGSSRIHGINLHQHLEKNSIASYILSKPSTYSEILNIGNFGIKAIAGCNLDFVVFQRVHNGDTIHLINTLNAHGTITIFIMADIYEATAINAVKIVITTSERLKEVLIERGHNPDKIYVIPDAIETDFDLCKDYSINNNEKITLVWVGAEGHWQTLENLKNILSENTAFKNFNLKTISNHPDADIEWNLSSVWREIIACDIGVIPVDLTRIESSVKSNNRATMFKALGLPVICSPLPAYISLIRHGYNGFIANSTEDWLDALTALSQFSIRKKIGLTGRDEVFRKFGMNKVGQTLIQLLSDNLPNNKRITDI